jgi:tyrosine-protein phosphatase SIW14
MRGPSSRRPVTRLPFGALATTVAAILLAAAMARSAFAAEASPERPRIPNFGRVESDLFRGGRLGPSEVDELARLGVKTVLKLNRRDLESERTLCEAKKIRLISVPLSPFEIGDGDPEKVRALCRAIQVLRDPTVRPLYVHCTRGIDRTGAVIGIYRRLVSGWDLERVRDEMRAFGSGAFRRVVMRSVDRAVETFDPAFCGATDPRGGGTKGGEPTSATHDPRGPIPDRHPAAPASGRGR